MKARRSRPSTSRLSLALERDREVVLVDGDVAKAHMTHLFGLDGEPGFLDLG